MNARRLAPLGLLFAACAEDELPRLPPFDGGPRDATTLDAASADAGLRDLGVDLGALEGGTDTGTVDVGGTDASRDAGASTPGRTGCTVGPDRVLTVSTELTDFEPTLASIGSSLEVAYLTSSSGIVDIAARRVPPSGSVGAEFGLTQDSALESSPALTPSGADYVLAYTRDTGSSDIATIGFDPVTGAASGIVDVTNDGPVDRSPAFGSTSTSIALFFERVDTTTVHQRIELGAAGGPLDSFSPVTTDRVSSGAFAVDGRSSDRRLFRIASTTVFESAALDGAGRSSGTLVQTLGIPSGSLVGRIRITPAYASARGVLGSATVIGRNAGYLARVDATGRFVGAAIDVVPERSIESPALAHVGDGYLVAYRVLDAGLHVRVRVFDAAGLLVGEDDVATLGLLPGRVEALTVADGSVTYLVYDTYTIDGYELRALQLTCPVP